MLGQILRSLLLALSQPILMLLSKVNGGSEDLIKTLTDTVNSLGNDLGKLLTDLPAAVVGGGSQEGSTGGGGGLLGVVGGLLSFLIG